MRPRAIVAVVVVMAAAVWYAAYRTCTLTVSIARELTHATTLTRVPPRAQASIVFDRTGAPAFSFFVERRIDVPLTRVSPTMIDAILAVEDRRFYLHHGVDPIRITTAALRNLRAGRIVEGGSTITQQLARAMQLSPVRTYERKIREAMIAIRLEERYSKADILTEYLNTVYFGEGFYGVEAAARGYFGKAAAALTAPEAALLAALVRAPSSDAPSASSVRARRRRDLVLRRMRDQGRLSASDFAAAVRTPLPAINRVRAGTVSTAGGGSTGLYFQEEVRRQLFAMFGADRVLRGGLRAYSTYDPALQAAAENAISARVAQIVKTRRRSQALQGSLVAIDPRNGDVLALVGGRDFRESSFNRATQARRQAGSAFKPIIYAAALERGYAPGSLLRDLDTPIDSVGGRWLPGGEHERSEYTLRRALKLSSNRAAAQLLDHVGVSTAVYYAHRLGIGSELPMVPSLALGTGEVTLMELTAAYSTFANRGRLSTPRLITRVEDRTGNVIWQSPAQQTQAISPTTAFLMSSMLADVVSSGTATTVRTAGFKLPAAGKTGTTDDYADAWFVGYTPHIVAGVWFGLDRPAPIMNRGFAGIVAVPAWAQFMTSATRGDKAEWYETPPDVEKVAICRLSGARATEACRHANDPFIAATSGFALVSVTDAGSFAPVPPADSADPPVYEDLFPIGTIPAEPCPVHNAAPPAPSATPAVDGLLQQAAAVPTINSSAAAPRATRVFVERVPQADGTYKLVLRERQ